MISLRDWVGAAAYLAEHPTAAGPVNLCCVDDADQRRVHPRRWPTPCTGRRSRRCRRRSSRSRPAACRSEVLGSMNVRPQALLDLGYEFADPDVTAVLASGLS